MDELWRALAVLPGWLADLVDPAQLRSALEAALPETQTGALEIVACQARRLRLTKASWVGQYEVAIRRRGEVEPQLVRLAAETVTAREAAAVRPRSGAAFGHPVWQAYLADLGLLVRTEQPDAALPALPLLTDPEAARGLLERGMQRAGPAYRGFHLRSCLPQVLRYKPGSRCTVLYRLEYAEGCAGHGWPDAVIAKTYEGEKGSVAWTGMRALWDSPIRSSAVAIAEPLVFLPEFNLLVQRALREDSNLKKVIRQRLQAGPMRDHDELPGQLSRAAAGLAALHQCGVSHGQLVTWGDELAKVRGMVDRIAAVIPEVGPPVEPLLAHLAERAAVHGADPAGPAHGSFRPDQVLLGGDEMGFVDFDGFCQAEPARDLALFRTTVRQLGWQPEHSRILADLADEFLTEYNRHKHVSPMRVALWEMLELLTRVLNCWTKVKPDKLPGAVAALRTQLAAEPFVST